MVLCPAEITAPRITKPNPINAEPDDEFGFSETVTNFPNII